MKRSLRLLVGPVLASVAACTLSWGCARELPGETPPSKAFYFPSGVAVSANGEQLYVVSSNFDLRFNSGWITVLNVADLAQDDASWDSQIQQLKIPSLGGTVAASPDGRYVAVAHRGTPTLSLFEVDAVSGKLFCGEANATTGLTTSEERADCDRTHLVRVDANDDRFGSSLTNAELLDPYALTFFSGAVPDAACAENVDALACQATTGCLWRHAACGREATLLAVGFISSGRLLIYEVRDAAVDNELLVPVGALALGSSGTGSIASYPTSDGDYLALGSRFFGDNSVRATIYNVDVARSLQDDRNRLVAVSLGGNTGAREIGSLLFSAGGDVAYATTSIPDGIVSFDTTLGGFEEPAGADDVRFVQRPKFALRNLVPLSGQPSGMAHVSLSGGDYLAVASFANDALFLIAARGEVMAPALRFDKVGLGPFQLATAAPGGDSLVFVSTFYDHGLAVWRLGEPLEASAEVVHLRDPSLGDAREQR